MSAELFFIYDSHCPWCYATMPLLNEITNVFPEIPLNLWHSARYEGDENISLKMLNDVENNSTVNFPSLYTANEQEAKAANGGAYPPDMSVLVKARKGGADYIYSLLLGYSEPPEGVELDDGVYYNKYMYGNKIKMPAPLSDDLIEYTDGTKATAEQMSKDVTNFLMWSAEPHLEQRHKTGFRVIAYLIILTVLVYFTMKKIWSRVESKV